MEHSNQLRVAATDVKFGPSQLPRHNTPMQTITEFSYNGIGFVWVLTREGISYRINSYSSDRRIGEQFGFIINKFFRHAVDVESNIQRESMLEGNRNMAFFDNLLTTGVKGQHRELYVTYFVSDTQLSNAGGVLYVAEADIVLCTVNPHDKPIVHPYGAAAATAARDGLIYVNSIRGTTARWFIVDNERICGCKYMMVCGEAVCIRTTEHGSLESGLYVQVQDETSPNPVKRFYPIKDVMANKLPFRLSDSMEHALSYNEAQEHELNVGTLKRSAEEIRQENQIRKELSQIADENAELRQQLMNQQAEFAERSRKEQESILTAIQAATKEREAEFARQEEARRKEYERQEEQRRKDYEQREEARRKESEQREETRRKDAERIQLERERLLKDAAEQEKSRRQQTLEVMKAVPVVLGIALTVLQLFSKAKSK